MKKNNSKKALIFFLLAAVSIWLGLATNSVQSQESADSSPESTVSKFDEAKTQIENSDFLTPEQKQAEKSEELRKKTEDAKQISETLDRIISTFNKDIRIRFDERWDGPVTQVIDTRTQDVIRQIPPEELLRVAERIQRFLGVMLDLEA